MRLVIIVVLLVSSLSGCITSKTGMLYEKQPTQEELSSWKFGEYPENYQEIISSCDKFKSTSISKIYIEYQGAPTKTWVPDRIGNSFKYGWGGFVSKSSHEIGKIKYRYLIRDGKIILLEKYNENQMYW